MTNYDVVISGAGPAGTSCAIHLAASGLKIALIDKAVFPRDKICGGGLSDRATNALKRMPGNIWTAFLNEKDFFHIEGISITNPKGETASLSCPVNYGYTVTRKNFDQFLLNHALKTENLTFFQDEKSLLYEHHKNDISITTNNQKINAQILIIADGFSSILARQTNLINYNSKKTVVCVQTSCKLKENDAFNKQINLYYQKSLLPFYFWFFPLKNNMVNIGLGMKSSILRKNNHHILEVFKKLIAQDEYLKQRLQGAITIDKPKISLLPLNRLGKKFSTDRIMITGTAAMIVDPISGEGIGNALLSGEFAAQQIIECFNTKTFDAGILKNYDEKLKKRLSSEFIRNKMLLTLFSQEKLINFGVRKTANNENFRKKIEEMLIKNKSRWNLFNPFFYM